MKKVLSIVAALLLCAGTQAQIVSSRSSIVRTEKAQSSTLWFARAGINIMNYAGDGASGTGATIGYDANVGFHKSIGAQGAYWGMDFGLTSRGFKIDDTKAIAHAVQVSPFNFGWKLSVADKVTIDPHIGVAVSCDYTSKMKETHVSMSWKEFGDLAEADYMPADVAMNVGAGIWYDRFNLDFTYHHGFLNTWDAGETVNASNFMIRLGVAF